MARVAAVAGCCALVAGGCSGERDDAAPASGVRTQSPAVTFAPLVRLHPRERRLPTGARRFIDHAALWLAEDQGCEDRKVAVGRKLEAQRNDIVDWLYLTGLGEGPAYRRAPYDAACENDHYIDIYANQLTRPRQRAGRTHELRLGEGYYLDLADRARAGPGRAALGRTPAYVERRRTRVEGEPGLRLSYWLLFGMHEPRSPAGHAVERLAHEGDWERVDVLLRGGDGAYAPVAVELAGAGGDRRRLPWRSLRRERDGPGGAPTHPLLTATLGSHALRAERTAAGAERRCGRCAHWRTWRRLVDVRDEPWYGFGGAWGEIGPTEATTGPLGPGGDLRAVATVDDDDPSIGLDAVVARRPHEAFAPLIHHHPGEGALPIAADRFLQRSTLKWRDDGCPGLVDVATGRIADRKTHGPVPRLDPRRLGGRPPYRHRADGRNCQSGGGRTYSTTDRTRPYLRRGRAAGLPPGSGFYLDLLSDSYDGDARVERRDGRRLVAGVPAYHDRRRVDSGALGRTAVRFSYWLLYPHTELVDPGGERVVSHEGGWQRLDVIAIRGRRDHHWLPTAVRYHGDELDWADAPRAGDDGNRGDGDGATHPVAYSARASHTLHPRPGAHRRRLELDERTATVVDRAATCPDCVRWPTWERLEPLHAQPWREFGGGWGAAFRATYDSGPAGPR